MGGSGRLFEAATQSQSRRYIPQVAKDTRQNLTDWGWTQLVSASRSMCANFAPIGEAISQMANYAVGRGFNVQFRGSDKAWGEKMEAALEQWDKIADIKGHPNDFRSSLVLDLISMVRDGDANTILCDTGNGWPVFQTIPAHRVNWSGEVEDGRIKSGPYAGSPICNGVIQDSFGRPIAYRLSEDGEMFTDVSADSFLQTYKPSFCDQSRGIPWLAPAINDIADIFDIRDFTKLGLKGVASRIMIEHDDGSQDGQSPITGGPISRTDQTQAMERLEGGTIIRYRAGSNSKVEIPDDKRPSENSREFSFEILRGAFSALGWPVEFYDPSRLGGANIRLRVAQAKRTIETLQGMADTIAKRKHLYAIAKLIKLGVLPPNDQWWMIEHQRPRDITVDNGRDSKAELEALNNGAMTFAEYFGRSGADWQESFDQRIAEQKYLKEKCAEAGVEVADIRASVLTKQDPAAAQTGGATSGTETEME